MSVVDEQQRITIRRSVRVEGRSWLLLAVFFFAAAWGVERFVETGTWATYGWVTTVSLLLLLAGGWTLLRDVRGRITLEFRNDQLTICEVPRGMSAPQVLESSTVDGFWIRALPDGEGPPASFELMIDQGGLSSRRLFGRIPELGPLVAVSETCARLLGVPSDTRSNAFR